MAHSPRERILDDIISGIKVDIEETEQSEEPADTLKTSNSHVQVPQKDSCPEPASLYPLKPQLDVKAEDGHSSVPLISEDLPTNKSRLSPLAARAALASLVSTGHNDGANGTGLDDHHVSKTLPIMDYTSSEDPSTLEPVSGVLDVVKKLSLDENTGPLNPQLEESTALKGPKARSKRSTVSTGLAKTGRVTRSFIQKANSSPMDAGAIPRSTSTDGQDCPLPSGFDDKANLTSKEGKRTGQSAKRKLDELQTPARVTRSAVQKSPGNAVNGDQVKSSNEGASKKRRRSTPSTGLEKTDDFTGSQGLDNDHSFHSTKADDSEMNMSQTGSVLSQKKKKISPHMDLEEQTPPTKKVKAKASSSTKKAKQTEGKTTGRKGKSPEQKTKPTSGKRDKKSASNSNQRFSPRLHFLPRTRSQVKS